MQIVKPMQQGIMFRTFSKDRRFYLSVASLSFFPFHNSQALGTEQQMWETITASLYEDMLIDSGMPKSQGEVIVVGKCCAPAGKPLSRHFVDLDIGPIQKRLVVTGNRYWNRGDVNSGMMARMVGHDWRASTPEPFEKIDIGWKNAFGGEGFPQNPIGKGFFSKGTEPSFEHNSPLPNIETSKLMMSEEWSTADVFDKWELQSPAGYGPVDAAWPQRAGKVGKQYDKHWEDNLYPEPARDMDPTYYNMAPVDQQLNKSLFKGDETFSISGMHPDNQLLKSQIPQINPRCFVLQTQEKGEKWSEITMSPETVWLFPNVQRGILINRGVFEIDTFYGVDVDSLLLAWELKDGASRTPQDYRDSLERRENEETAPEWSAREDDLSPPEGIPEEEPIFLDDEEDDQAENSKLVAAETKAQATLGKAADMISRAGLDPKQYLPQGPLVSSELPVMPPLKKMSDVGGILAWAKTETAKAEALVSQMDAQSGLLSGKTQAEAKKIVEDRARDMCKRVGKDYDVLKAQAAKNPTSNKPLVQRTAELLKKSKSKVAGNPAALAKIDGALGQLEQAEFQMKAAGEKDDDSEAMVLGAHLMTPKDMPSAEKNADLRSWVLERYAAKENMSEVDLTGVDLSNLELAGADFEGATLECANMSNSVFTGAIFSKAVLARADFSNSQLDGVSFAEAGLGKGMFQNAVLKDADFTGAVIDEASFEHADMSGAAIKVDLCQKVGFEEANLSNADLAEAQFIKSNFTGSKLTGANIEKASFMESTLVNAIFEECNLVGTSFIEVDATGASFNRSQMEDANAHLDSKFANCSFVEIEGASLNLSQTDLSGSDFSLAKMKDASFGESTLKKAVFDQVIARKADFTDADLTEASIVGADLMQSSMQGASLVKAQMAESNLFGVDFLFANMDGSKIFMSNVKRTLLEGK